MNLLKTSRFLFSEVMIKSVPGHKAPALSDNPVGRYAGSLFSSASQKQSLHIVLEDLTYLEAVLKESVTLREFIKNSAIKRQQQRQVVSDFGVDNLSAITISFLNTLIQTGRLSDLPKIIQTYQKYYKILNKQEDIKIISHKQLNQTEQKRVVEALQVGRKGISFKVSYEVDPTILGGLQIYSGSTFLDCSLRSRMERLRSQLSKLA